MSGPGVAANLDQPTMSSESAFDHIDIYQNARSLCTKCTNFYDSIYTED
jgi:hypothetical protein